MVSFSVPAKAPSDWPAIRPIGVDGMLVSFADTLSEPANRAALAFRAVLDQQNWSGLEETASSLVSTYLRFNPRWANHTRMEELLSDLLLGQDWYAAPLPAGRTLWRIPTVFGTELAPQFDEAAQLAGLTPAQALADLSRTRVRVQTIGFAPGQPYLGPLPPAWDIPRQTSLTAKVPVGALTVAIRQFVLFSAETPTGWRHVGQTHFRPFLPEAELPFVLRPGDEVVFEAVSTAALSARKTFPHGGATAEAIRDTTF